MMQCGDGKADEGKGALDAHHLERTGVSLLPRVLVSDLQVAIMCAYVLKIDHKLSVRSRPL